MSDTPRTDACLSSEFANLKALNLLIAESRKLERKLATALERVKRLEEAGNNVAFRLSLWRLSEGKWLCEEDAEAWKAWHQAKEAKP